jgi:hypothetical protein
MKHTRQHAPLPHLYLQAYSFNAERFTPRRRPKSEHFIGTPHPHPIATPGHHRHPPSPPPKPRNHEEKGPGGAGGGDKPRNTPQARFFWAE